MPNAREEDDRNPAYWLGQHLRQIRDQNGNLPRRRVAQVLDVAESTVTRFENARKFPPRLDLYLAGYAKVAGIADPREILLDAVRLWISAGAPPTLGPRPGELRQDAQGDQPTPEDQPDSDDHEGGDQSSDERS